MLKDSWIRTQIKVELAIGLLLGYIVRYQTYTKLFLSILLVCTSPGCMRSKVQYGCVRSDNAEIEKYCLYQNINVPKSPLSIEDIICIALKRNLALKVKAQECAIQREILTSERAMMIPELMAKAEWNERNNNPGSSSASLEPGVPPAPPSVSSKRSTGTSDIEFTWNLLDFGLSYLRSRQEANNLLIQQLEYQRLQQNLILDLVRQYWFAVAAKQGVDGAKEIIERTNIQIEAIEKKIYRRIMPKIRGLRMADELVQVQIDLHIFEKDYHFAIAEMKELMGIPPSIDIEIDAYPETLSNAKLFDVSKLEELALQYRPELYGLDIQEKIDCDEVRASFLQMIPGISLFDGFHYNDNPFLIKNGWLLAGARVSWDLFRIPHYYYKSRVGLDHKGLTKRNRLVLAMAALSQVNLAHCVYHDDLKHYELAKTKSSIKDKLMKTAFAAKRRGKLDEADVIHIQAEALRAHVERIDAYGDSQVSLEQINNAIGIPRFFRNSEMCYEEFQGELELEEGVF